MCNFIVKTKKITPKNHQTAEIAVNNLRENYGKTYTDGKEFIEKIRRF